MTTPSRAPLSASGSLEELQASLLAHGARDFAGSFEVRTRGLVGEIKIANGCLVSSTLGAAQDEIALTRILLADAGSFSTQPQTISAANGAPKIAAALSAASREAKVLTEASSTVGGLARIWSVRFRALDQVLKEIPKEVSPLLRLLDGTRSINDLFVESSLPPRVTVRVLSRLLSMGVLVLPDDALAGEDDAISIEESGKNVAAPSAKTSVVDVVAKTSPAPEPVVPKTDAAKTPVVDDVVKTPPVPESTSPKVDAAKTPVADKAAKKKPVDDVAKKTPPAPKVAKKTPVVDIVHKTPVVHAVAKTVTAENIEAPKKPAVAAVAKKPDAKKQPEEKTPEAKKPEAKKPEAKATEEKKPEEKPEAKKPEAKAPEEKKPEAKKNDDKGTEEPRPLPEPDAREQTPTQESIAVNRWSSPKEEPKKVEPATPPAMPTQEALLEAAASIPSVSDVASIDAWLGKEKDFFRATSRDMQRTEAHEAIPHAPDIFWKIVALFAIATLVLGVVAAFTIDWDKAGTIPSRDRPTTSIHARSLDQEA